MSKDLMRCNSDVSGKKLIKPKLKQTGKSVGKDSRKELRTQLKNSFAWVYIVNFTNVGQQYLSSFTLYFGE